MKRANRKKTAKAKPARSRVKTSAKKRAARKTARKPRARKSRPRSGVRRAATPKRSSPRSRKKPSVKKPVRTTIHLVEPDGPDDAPTLSVSTKDQVRWANKTNTTRKLTFVVWIFTQSPRTISVRPKHQSRWFTIAPGTPYGAYGYAIDPEFPGEEGTPPDPPEVSAGP